MNNLPLVQFCRPSSWRNYLEDISAERGISLNVVLEADSISLQTQIVSEGGIYALLGPYAVDASSRQRRSKTVMDHRYDPLVGSVICPRKRRTGLSWFSRMRCTAFASITKVVPNAESVRS